MGKVTQGCSIVIVFLYFLFDTYPKRNNVSLQCEGAQITITEGQKHRTRRLSNFEPYEFRTIFSINYPS